MGSGGSNPPTGATLVYHEPTYETSVTVTGGIIHINTINKKPDEQPPFTKEVKLSQYTLEIIP